MATTSAERARKWREANPEKARARDRSRYRRDPEQALARERRYQNKLHADAVAALGGKCSECGTTDDLQVDHVAGDGKEDRKRRSQNTILRAARDGEPGFQALCKPHNLAKRITDRIAG
jgi:hypothetical protein